MAEENPMRYPLFDIAELGPGQGKTHVAIVETNGGVKAYMRFNPPRNCAVAGLKTQGGFMLRDAALYVRNMEQIDETGHPKVLMGVSGDQCDLCPKGVKLNAGVNMDGRVCMLNVVGRVLEALYVGEI